MTEYKDIDQAFNDSDSQVVISAGMIDIVGSTMMKMTQPLAMWLTAQGYFYRVATELLTALVPDVVLKYEGDAVLFFCDTDHATDLVNAVIQVLERVERSGMGPGGEQIIDFHCSAAISTGSAVAFRGHAGGPDFVGPAVDKAFRLTGAASGSALFVDTQTLGAANTTRFTSTFGKAVKQQPDQYVGELQRVELKGFPLPVSYHEILWDRQLHGVKSAAVTATATRAPLSPKAVTVPAPRKSEPGRVLAERHRGELTFWDGNRDLGFVQSSTGEAFHLSSRQLVYRDDAAKLAVGTEVAFVATGEASGKRKRSAGAVLLLGEPAEGHLVSLPAGKAHGWLRVVDVPGNHQLVFVPAADVGGCTVGDLLSFTADANERGAIAREVAKALEDAS